MPSQAIQFVKVFSLPSLPELNPAILKAAEADDTGSDPTSGLSSTSAPPPNLTQAVPSATGSYYPENGNTSTTSETVPTLEIPVDSLKYGNSRPRRVVIRGTIIRDEDRHQD
jgi:hypothetical protein